MPDMDELKSVVFSMNPNSAVGPDGMGGKLLKVIFLLLSNFFSVDTSCQNICLMLA